MNREIKFRAYHQEIKKYVTGSTSNMFQWIEDGQLILLEELVRKDKNNKDIYTNQKFKFKYLEELNKPIELIGSFDYCDEELRYEIDIWDNEDYTCLSYLGNGTMYDFEVIHE